MDRHNVCPSRPQITLTPTTRHGTLPLASIQRGFCIIMSLSRYCTSWLVQPLPTFFYGCARIAFRYTRATWMQLAMIRPGDWALACNLKLIVIPYHLLACRSFSHVHIQFLPHLGLGHRLMKSTITTHLLHSTLYKSLRIALDSFFLYL